MKKMITLALAGMIVLSSFANGSKHKKPKDCNSCNKTHCTQACEGKCDKSAASTCTMMNK